MVLFLAGVLAVSGCELADQDVQLSGDCGECTPWGEIGCGLGDCDSDEMRYERYCTGDIFSDERPASAGGEIPLKSPGSVPAGCIEKCVYSSECGNTSQGNLTEYKYEIELIENYEINNGTPDSEIEEDVVLVTAVGQAGMNEGLKLGPFIDSYKVVIVAPDMPGERWGPKYFMNDDGDYEHAGEFENYTLLFSNGGGLLDYVPQLGQMYYEPYSLNIDDHMLIYQIVSPGEGIHDGFKDFGYYPSTSERFEFFVYGYSDVWGENYLGEYEGDLVLSEQMIVRDVKENLETDRILFSFFI